jgi:prevent-host-death family protein
LEAKVELRTVGIRELKANISDILRQVEEKGEIVEVTRHGNVVARLVPARSRLSDAEIRASLASLDALAAEISKHIKGPTNVAEMLSDMRR